MQEQKIQHARMLIRVNSRQTTRDSSRPSGQLLTPSHHWCWGRHTDVSPHGNSLSGHAPLSTEAAAATEREMVNKVSTKPVVCAHMVVEMGSRLTKGVPVQAHNSFLDQKSRKVTRAILKVFSVMFSARTALDYTEHCFGGQAQSLIAVRC